MWNGVDAIYDQVQFIDAGTPVIIHARFERFRVAKFTTPVSQDGFEKLVGKYLTVSDLCFVALTCLELLLTFQADVTAGKRSGFYVLVNGADRQAKPGMFHNDLIGGMVQRACPLPHPLQI